MGAEKANESWLTTLWRISWKTFEPEKGVIGILAFEVASLMSKVVKLWQCLSDLEVFKLREEILKSVGIRNLVSEDDEYLLNLALDELLGNLVYVAKSVVRLGKRCSDPAYHRLEYFFTDPVKNCSEWSGWEYRWKKMERKAKKMEKFVGLMLQLTQEQEVLLELEQTLRRMKANPSSDKLKLYEFQQKVIWQRQEVRNIRDLSPWNRSYDYIVRLLSRSLFTILERMTSVFGINKMASFKGYDSAFAPRSPSFPVQTQSSVHPSEQNLPLSHSGPLGRSVSTNIKKQQSHHRSFSFVEKQKTKRLTHIGPLKGCMDVSDSPIVHSLEPAVGECTRVKGLQRKDTQHLTKNKDVRFLSSSRGIYSILAASYSKHGRITTVAYTLGSAALALHYANLILLIEKLSASPHLIGIDARDDLYSMLPTSIRAALRARLKPFAALGKALALPAYDAELASSWRRSLDRMLDWLAPLAHNTIKWHSDRSIEKQHAVSGSNVLLVQTLYFANQAKTEAAITELLMGLNYLCTVHSGPRPKALPLH